MFEKYSAVLRGVPRLVPFLTKRFEGLCLGNTYCATIHAINSALIKLSRIATAAKVYRGVSGMALPERFLTADEFGVRGGVEFGFLSATADRAVAMQYAAQSVSGIVYEIQQSMGDRGADLSWLSMYPYEAEVCFPPVLGLEVMTTADGAPAKRCEGSVVVLELRPSVASAFSIGAAREPPSTGMQWDLLPKLPPSLVRACCPWRTATPPRLNTVDVACGADLLGDQLEEAVPSTDVLEADEEEATAPATEPSSSSRPSSLSERSSLPLPVSLSLHRTGEWRSPLRSVRLDPADVAIISTTTAGFDELTEATVLEVASPSSAGNTSVYVNEHAEA